MVESNDCAASAAMLTTGLEQLGIRFQPGQTNRFVRYCQVLRAANEVSNLTGVRSAEGIMSTLFLDSLTVAFACPSSVAACLSEAGASLVDVGAGAGIPGIPLKIAFPDIRLTLVESIGKKAAFLRDAITRLDLTDSTVEQRRAEEVGWDSQFREKADLCVARAVASLSVLIELCAPLARPGGILAFPKSGNVEQEIKEAQQAALALGVRLEEVTPVPSALGLGERRYVVLYRRVGRVPNGYPRRVGLARSRPVGAGSQVQGSRPR